MAFIENSAIYDQDLPTVLLVRTAIEGSSAIKRGQTIYLPHPSMIDKTSAAQVARYKAYIGRAEFDSSCAQTKIELMGAYTRAAHEIDLPDVVKYLEGDSDGDWLSLSDSINITTGNCLEVKYHFLLAEFESPEIPDGVQISRAEKAKLNQRAKIVHYPRESLTNWDFSVKNGRMQLTHAVLTSESTELDSEFKEVKTKTQLLLNLDEDGFYRQKLITQTGDKSQPTEGDWIYPKAMGKNLDFIPAEFVIDQRSFAGKLPRATGYLEPIALKDVARYQVNADLKEKLAVLQDTINTTGWTEHAWEEYKRINGRSYIATGLNESNQFPSGVEFEVMKMQADGDAHFKYIAENEKQTRALGGRYDTEPDTTNTATEAAIKSAKENAVLTMLATNLEQSYRRLVCYCAQYEGEMILPENVKIEVNRQFSGSKMPKEEAEIIVKQYDSGLMSKPSAVAALKAGGYGDPDLSTNEELDLIEQEAPPPVALPAQKTGGAHNNAEVQP
jgi:hypothetical protein